MSRLSYVAAAFIVASLVAAPAAAVPITLDAVDSGAYFANGTHNPAIDNYLTGVFNGVEHRSFFVFDLSTVTGTIESATLRLFNPNISPFQPGYQSPDPTEDLNIYDVTTDPADIVGNLAGVAGFGDLGSGTLYGARVVSAADNGTVVEIVLNAAALANLNAAGGLVVLGGAIGTLTPAAAEFVFGFSMADFVADHTRELVLEVRDVPEPALLVLVGTAVFARAIRLRSFGASARRAAFAPSELRRDAPPSLLRLRGRRFAKWAAWGSNPGPSD